MKRFLRVSMACFLLMVSTLAFAASEVAPLDIVRTTTDNVLARVKTDKENLRADPGKMFDLVSELIFPHFDFAIMAQWVLGDSWAGADETTRTAFVDQFRKLLVRTYAGALWQVSDETIVVRPRRAAADDTEVLVRTEIRGRGDPIQLDYRLEKTPGEGAGWKIYNLNVLGVWLVETYRSQFAQEINAKGIDGLIATLAERNRANSARTSRS